MDNIYPSDWVAQKYSKVQKLWGAEYWLENNEKYCAKILALQSGYQCSLHYHKVKDETFIVMGGEVYLEIYPDPKEYLVNQMGLRTLCYLAQGDKKHLSPGTPHRFWCASDSNAVMLEISTPHSDSDVVRIEESRKCLTSLTSGLVR